MDNNINKDKFRLSKKQMKELGITEVPLDKAQDKIYKQMNKGAEIAEKEFKKKNKY